MDQMRNDGGGHDTLADWPADAPTDLGLVRKPGAGRHVGKSRIRTPLHRKEASPYSSSSVSVRMGRDAECP